MHREWTSGRGENKKNHLARVSEFDLPNWNASDARAGYQCPAYISTRQQQYLAYDFSYALLQKISFKSNPFIFFTPICWLINQDRYKSKESFLNFLVPWNIPIWPKNKEKKKKIVMKGIDVGSCTIKFQNRSTGVGNRCFASCERKLDIGGCCWG
jgi:hypothetical protein